MVITKSVALGGLIRTENIRGPSHVVAMRMSVERARMYSSISGVILIGADLEFIESLNFQPYRYSFLEAAFGKNMVTIQPPNQNSIFIPKHHES